MALIPVFIRNSADVERHYLCQAEPSELPAVIEAVLAFDVDSTQVERSDGDPPSASGTFFADNGKAGFEIIVS